jgi:hypothetical protein
LKRRFFTCRALEPQPSAEQELPFALGKIGLNDYEICDDEKTFMRTDYNAAAFGTRVTLLVRREVNWLRLN